MPTELQKSDLETAYHCLRAVVYGPFIEDSQFQPRLGFTRNQMQEVASAWPTIDDIERHPNTLSAILACMNEVCHGIRFSEQEWRFWFSETPEEIRHVYLKWKG